MSLRLFWRRFHLWIGVATGLFLLGISLSGLVLMFDDKVNKLVRPDLFAVSGPVMTQAADVYFAKAREAVPNGEPYQLRYPEEEGHPALVMMRLKDARGRGEGARGEGARNEAARGEGKRAEAARTEANADAALNNAPAADQTSELRNAEHANGEGERGTREQRGNGERRGGGNGTGGGNMGAGGGNMGGGMNGGGGRPRVLAVYMDPPTAKVLGTADPRSSLVGWALALHANLFLQPYGGRQIVGWIGCGLFILCASGLYLWWPRGGGSFLRGLRWWRGPMVSINLHHRVGFWIVIPLGVMAFTGFIQGFPQQSRTVTGALMPTTAQPPRGGAGNGTVTPVLAPQQVLDLASAEAAGFHPTLLALPQEAGKPWRVLLENAAGDHKTLFVDDAKASVSAPPEALQGDSVLAFLRRIHEGSHDGPVWETIVFLTALTPPLFFVTGVMMWLRRRKNTKALAMRTKTHQTNVAAAAGAE